MTIDDYLVGIERGLQQNVHKGQRVFRYDNAPHHPELITYPHHKHIGPTDRLAPADQPTLSLVLAEVESWLGQ